MGKRKLPGAACAFADGKMPQEAGKRSEGGRSGRLIQVGSGAVRFDKRKPFSSREDKGLYAYSWM